MISRGSASVLIRRKWSGHFRTVHLVSSASRYQRVVLDRNDIVVRQRSLRFGRGLGIEGAAHGIDRQAGFLGYLAGDAFGATAFRARFGFRRILLRNLAARFQQLGIAPDMFVALILGKVESVICSVDPALMVDKGEK